MVTYEELLEDAGGFGLYQIYVLLWSGAVIMILGGTNGFMIFGGLKMFKDQKNVTTEQNASIALQGTKGSQFHSLVDEFNFTSADAYKVTLITSSGLLGMLFGYLLAGHLSDKFGRKPVFVPFLVGLTLFNFILGYCLNWIVFMCARFMVGIFIGGSVTVIFVWSNELMPPKWRTITNVVSWPLGYIFVALVAKFTNNWRDLIWYCLIPAPLALVMTIWTVDSPKLLIQQQKFNKAKQAFLIIGKWNRVRMSPLRAKLEIMANQSVGKKYNRTFHLFDLFYSRLMTIQLFALGFGWISLALNYFALLYNIGNIGGDPAMNLIYAMIMRFGVNILVPLIDQRTTIGRRSLTLLALTMIGMCHLAMVTLHYTGASNEYPRLSGIIPLFGTAFCTVHFAMAQVCTVEMVPTLLRTIAMGFMLSLSRIGAVVAPQVFLLTKVHRAAPYICLLPSIVICMLLTVLVLPETKGHSLPDLPESLNARNKRAQKATGPEKNLVDTES